LLFFSVDEDKEWLWNILFGPEKGNIDLRALTANSTVGKIETIRIARNTVVALLLLVAALLISIVFF